MRHLRHIFEKEQQVWYHGSDSKFDAFDMSKTKNGPSAFGLWFTDDPEAAKMFGENVYKCELSYQNPKVITRDRWDDIRGEHAKDTEYFKKWKHELMLKGYDALFIKERMVKFASHDIRDGNMVCVFDQDEARIIKESEELNENRAQGFVLISGEDGKLYAVNVTDTTQQGTGTMAYLGNEFYRIMQRDGELVSIRPDMGGRSSMLKKLGLSTKNISGEKLKLVLNSKTGKTPLHWETLKYTYMPKMLKELGGEILKIEGVNWG